LAPRHEESSSVSNDPIGELEAQVEQLRTELQHRNRVWADDSQRIAELSAEVGRLWFELSERDSAIDWTINSRSILGIVKQKLEPVWMSSAWPLITCKYIVILYMRKYMYCMADYTRTCPLILLE
jgi:hypothetical protein